MDSCNCNSYKLLLFNDWADSCLLLEETIASCPGQVQKPDKFTAYKSNFIWEILPLWKWVQFPCVLGDTPAEPGGWGYEQPDLAVDVYSWYMSIPVYCRRVGLPDLWVSLPTQMIPWSHDTERCADAALGRSLSTSAADLCTQYTALWARRGKGGDSATHRKVGLKSFLLSFGLQMSVSRVLCITPRRMEFPLQVLTSQVHQGTWAARSSGLQPFPSVKQRAEYSFPGLSTHRAHPGCLHSVILHLTLIWIYQSSYNTIYSLPSKETHLPSEGKQAADCYRGIEKQLLKCLLKGENRHNKRWRQVLKNNSRHQIKKHVTKPFFTAPWQISSG